MIILIGNKADLEAQRDVTYEEAKQFAEENGESDTEQCMLGRQDMGFRRRRGEWFLFTFHHSVSLFNSLRH